MPSKQEYEDTLNELFSLSVKWSNMTKEDLSSFVTFLSDTERVATALGLETKSESQPTAIRGAFVDGLVSGLVKRADSLNGPLARAVKKSLEKNI